MNLKYASSVSSSRRDEGKERKREEEGEKKKEESTEVNFDSSCNQLPRLWKPDRNDNKSTAESNNSAILDVNFSSR